MFQCNPRFMSNEESTTPLITTEAGTSAKPENGIDSGSIVDYNETVRPKFDSKTGEKTKCIPNPECLHL